MGGPAMLAAGVAGMDVTYVAVALNTTPIVIMGSVAKMEELKGKAIEVTRYGSNTDISARFAIRKAGLQPEKEVALIQLEDYAGMAACSRAEWRPARWPIRLPIMRKG
jgi:ABC-type nitrate/sulfonate/bicarbonate transport system substrate-binding protein